MPARVHDDSPTPVLEACWRRLDLAGHDAARLTPSGTGWELEGSAVFLGAGRPARLDYAVRLASDWTTTSCRIRGFFDGRLVRVSIRRTSAGWSLNGEDRGLAHLLDLDLGFTPATNFQQLRRLDLAVGEEAELSVAWLDAGASNLVELPQRYRRLDALRYGYEARSVPYAGVLRLSPSGFVACYPGLWAAETGGPVASDARPAAGGPDANGA